MEGGNCLCGEGGEAAANELNSLRVMRGLCPKSLSAARPVGHPHHAVRRPLGRETAHTPELMADWQESLFKDDSRSSYRRLAWKRRWAHGWEDRSVSNTSSFTSY